MFFSWQIVIFGIFAANASLAGSYIVRFISEKKPKTELNKWVLSVIISSAIWSIGMGFMSLQIDDTAAYIWRVFGIFGTFMFMISVQKTLCLVSDVPKLVQKVLNAVAYSGIVVFLLYIRPGQTIFVRNAIGTTFYFKPGLVNTIYSLYYVIVSINLLGVTIHTVFFHRYQRMRKSAVSFILVEMLIFTGAIGDMIIPTFGYPALPGSALTQFYGVIVFWYAIHKLYKNQITIANMSEYIYFSLGIPVIILDADKKLRIMNDAAMDFFDAEKMSLEKDDYVLSDILDVSDEVLQFDNKSTILEARNKKDIICQLAISKIDDKYGDTVGYILLVSDLSDHYMVIQKLEEAKKASDAANMSKSLFLANMSHEIRTPMNAILGISQIAVRENVDEKAKTYFEDITQAGDTLLNIINDILSISKIESGKQELVCTEYKPARIFNDVSLIIEIEAQKKQLEFSMDIDRSFPEELYGDKDKIREVLINILNNSVKYTNKGKISFESKITDKNNDEVTIQYIVKDTGIGIKEEDLGSIFETFKRMDAKANSKTEGTGLGLSITKGFVDLMGGNISVESVYGEGTTFTVELKQKIVNSQPISLIKEKEKTEESKNTRFKNAKVLSVDDNKMNRKVLAKCLEHYDIHCDSAESGIEAIELCKNNQYDIVFMDVMMPEMDGTEAMKNIRQIKGYEKGSNAIIIAFSADMIEGVKEERIKDGFDGFLGKPAKLDELEKVLLTFIPDKLA